MINLIIDHMDIWTSAQTQKTNGAGRGNHSANHSLHGIKKLRELILELAVQGKLIPQDPNDEPASVLLEKIAREKARLIKEGKLKKQEPLPEITDDEKVFELPNGWEWVRLGSIGETNIGLTYSPKDISDIGTPVLRSNNVQKGKLDLTDLVRVNMEIKNSVIVQEGDLLICARNGSKALVGKTAQVTGLSEEMAFGAFMAIFRSLVNDYVLCFINSPLFRKMIDDVNTTTINQITQNNLKTTMFPLPPLAEQRRIVSKVDELMAMCDQLEKQQTGSNATHQTLVETLLVTLTNTANQDEFAEAWQRIANHFDILFITEQSIDQLKQTILQLAVMGKLVPQNPNDEPASVLLKKIAAQKARLIKEGKIKKQEPLPEITDDEKLFNLPEGWEWTQLGNLSANIHYGYTTSADHGNSGVRLLRITDIQNDSVDWETVPGCEIEEKKANDYLLEDNDILIARTGGTIGKSYLVENIDVKAVFASYLIRVKRIEGMYSPFIKTYLGSQLYWQQLYENSMGTGQPNVNATALKRLVFPLPPIAEQHRIVAKVDELMALCDKLKARINDAQTTQIQLANTIVERAVM
jgi:type I restriction enzyme S subunit